MAYLRWWERLRRRTRARGSTPDARALRALHQLSGRLRHLRREDELAQTMIEILEETMGYEYGAILVLDPASGRLTPLGLSPQGRDAAFVEADRAYVSSQGVGVGKGLTGWVAQTGQGVRVGDVRADPRYLALRDDIRSELCVPLRIGEDVIGVVNTETGVPDAYTETDERLLETAAAQLALAIQNSRLYRQLEESVKGGLRGEAPAGLVSVCSYCKRVRDQAETWEPIEAYLSARSAIRLSHGICPTCYVEQVRPALDRLRDRRRPPDAEPPA